MKRTGFDSDAYVGCKDSARKRLPGDKGSEHPNPCEHRDAPLEAKGLFLVGI